MMRKVIAQFVIFSCLTVLVSGCVTKQEQTYETTAEFETPNWQIVSIAPEDYGIVYDDNLNFNAYSLDKLITYFLGSDGAYAEGSSDELYKRFMEAPSIVLTYISLIGDESVRNATPAKTALCQAIAAADVFWYDATDEFDAIIKKYKKIYPTGKIADILTTLKEEHDAAVKRNR